MLPLLVALPIALASPDFLDDGFVLQAADVPYGAGSVGAPTVSYDPSAGLYVMFFEAQLPAVPSTCAANAFQIGRATSPDGVVWSVDPAPVFTPAAADTTSPIHCSVSQPAVVFDGTTWHLFFSQGAKKATASATSNPTSGIGYATSTDGVTFTADTLSLIPYAGVSIGLASAAVLDEVLYLQYVYYPDLRQGTLDLRTGTWSFPAEAAVDHTAVGTWASQWVLSPALSCVDGVGLEVLVGGDTTAAVRSLGFLSSTDGTAWAPAPGAPLATDAPGELAYSALNHWDIARLDSGYQLWYSRTVSGSVKGIGVAHTTDASGLPFLRACSSTVFDPGDDDPVFDTGTDSGSTDSGTDSGTDTGADTGTDTGADTGAVDSGDPGDPGHGPGHGGCACSTPGAAPSASVAAAALAGLALLRRRRAAR